MSLVLDSSVALAWAYSDETTQAIRDVFDRIADNGGYVPSLWQLEVANVLQIGVNRGRTDGAFRDAVLAG